MSLQSLLVIAVTVASVTSAGVTVGLHPELHPIHSLYHSQNYNGQYSYGYATPMITRNEVRTLDGITRGGYSYMDTNGVIQTVQYTSDPLHGFQVAASNLPQDLPEVAAAKARHMALFQTIQTNHAQGAIPQAHLPQPVQDLPEVVAARQAHLAAMEAAKLGVMPQPVQDTPEVARAKAEHLAILEATRVRDESLRRSINLSPIPQDFSGSSIAIPNQQASPNSAPHLVDYKPAVGLANSNLQDLSPYSYGYVGPQISQIGSNNLYGVNRGGYSFIDPNGKLQTVGYVGDDGFQIQATNLGAPLSNNIESAEINQDQALRTEAATSSVNADAVQSNRGGFLINVGNSLKNSDDKSQLLYTQEVNF